MLYVHLLQPYDCANPCSCYCLLLLLALNVHEGPQRISRVVASDTQPLLEGMIVSNEPGYYAKDDFGIRIGTTSLHFT